MSEVFALHTIYDAKSPGFNPCDYSRFKFGDGKQARKFGLALADWFIEQKASSISWHNPWVIISSPHAFIPTATFAMKNHFVFRLNAWLAANNFPVLCESKIHRTVTYREDYGELSAEERWRLIGNDTFYIDKEFLKGKNILFLDDIKITGSHERMIRKMMMEREMNNPFYLLYFAELKNPTIPPSFENELNYAAVKSIFDLESIIQSADFVVNTRIVKYILNTPHETFQVFMQNQTTGFANLIFNMAIGNSYHTMEEYSRNLEYLRLSLRMHINKETYYGY